MSPCHTPPHSGRDSAPSLSPGHELQPAEMRRQTTLERALEGMARAGEQDGNVSALASRVMTFFIVLDFQHGSQEF